MAKFKRLGDLATYINGYPFKPDDRRTEGLPIIRIQDLTGNAYDLGFYNGEYPTRIEINDGDVLISWSASLGVYIWSRGKALLNQHIFKVVFDKADIDKQYFVYAVQHKLKEMESKAHGATMKHIVKKDFDNTLIPFPSLEQQREVADILSKTAVIIEARQKQLIALDDLIKARFVEMFGNDDYPSIPLIETIIPGAGLSYGIVVPGDNVDDGIPMVRPSDFKNGTLDLSNVYRVGKEIESKYSRTRLVGDEILVQVIGQPGQVMLATSECKGMNVTRNLAVIRPNLETINRTYLKYFIEKEDSQHFLLKNTKQSTLKQLPLNLLKQLEVQLPPMVMQNLFADFVKQVDKSKVVVQKALNEEKLLFDSLMQRYFG